MTKEIVTMTDRINTALRPPEHRVDRVCSVCSQIDDHPHIIALLPDGRVEDAHHDCVLNHEHPDVAEVAQQVINDAAGKSREALVEHLTANVIRLNETADARDAAAVKAHQVYAARHAFIEGAAITAAEAAAAAFDAGPEPSTEITALLDATFANALLAAEHDNAGTTVRLSTGPMKLRLMTTVGSAGSNGTELATSGGYTSGTGAGTITWGTPSAQSVATNAAYTVTNMPATSLNGVEEWDSAGTPLRKQLGPITGAPKTTNAGDTFTIASGSLTNGAT